MSDIESETLETYFHDKLDRSYSITFNCHWFSKVL